MLALIYIFKILYYINLIQTYTYQQSRLNLVLTALRHHFHHHSQQSYFHGKYAEEHEETLIRLISYYCQNHESYINSN